MSSRLYPLAAVLLALWAGSLWITGYVAVPVLFAELGDRQLAGRVAGVMFQWSGGLGIVSALGFAALLYGARFRARKLMFGLLLVVLAMAAVILLGIQPAMTELKALAAPEDVMASTFRDRFVWLHGISSVIYLLESLLLLVLVLLFAKAAAPDRGV